MDADNTTAESMTDIMSYQYPPPPPHGAEMGMSSSAYTPTYAPLPHSSEFGMGSEYDPDFPPRDRRDSFSTTMHLKRSMSTSNVRPELPLEQAHMQQQGQTVDHVSFLAADKRRNKLGYHRTSVACGQLCAPLSFFQTKRRMRGGIYARAGCLAWDKDWLTCELCACRPLQTPKDPMSPFVRRSAEAMHKLYPAEEGLQLFPG